MFVNLFDAKHLLYQLLWNMFSKAVEIADCMQTLFRGNSLASKIMAFCFKIYGQSYLRELLHPLIMDMFDADAQKVSYEVDPQRCVCVYDVTTRVTSDVHVCVFVGASMVFLFCIGLLLRHFVAWPPCCVVARVSTLLLLWLLGSRRRRRWRRTPLI